MMIKNSMYASMTLILLSSLMAEDLIKKDHYSIEELLEISSLPHRTIKTTDNKKQKNIALSDIQKQIKHEANPQETALLNKIGDSVQQSMKKRNITSINKLDLQRIFALGRAALDKNSVSKITLDELVDTTCMLILSYFKEHVGDNIQIPNSMAEEFINRKRSCILSLKKQLEQKKQTFIKKADIIKAVQSLYDGFIERMEHVQIWEWLDATLADINNNDRSQTPKTSIKPNIRAKEIFQRIKHIKQFAPKSRQQVDQ